MKPIHRTRHAAIVAGLFGCLLLAGVAVGQALDESEAAFELAPVTLDGHTLFKVRGMSALPASERAAMISTRIEEAAADPRFDPKEIEALDTPHMAQVIAGQRLFVRIFDADAEIERVDRNALATATAEMIRNAIIEYRELRRPEHLRKGVLAVLVASAILAAVITLILWVTGWIGEFLKRRLQPRVAAIKVQTLQLVPGAQVWATLAMIGRGFRLVLVALAVYIYADYSLLQFPQTRAMGERLGTYLIDPLETMGRGFLEELPSLIFLLILFFVVRVVLRVLRLYFDAVGSGAIQLANFAPEWAVPTYRLVRIGVIAFGLVVAYPYIPGSGSEAFKGLSIFFGVLISIGSSSFIANLVAGYALIYRRVFAVGDRVQIGDIVGEVIDMRLQVTRLRTNKNEEVIVPNSTILNSVVTNYSTLAENRGLILHTTVGIGYETPWRQVEGMLLMAAKRTPEVLAEPPPFVLQRTLGDFCVTYELNAYTSSADDMIGKYHALHANILDVFNEYGVQIMTPAYEGDPAEPKVVPKERWFEAPSAPGGGQETR